VQCSLALSQTQWPKKYAKKDFSQADFFFWLSGRSGNAPFKSCGEKTFQPAIFFSHTFSHIAVAPQHLAEG